MLHPIYFLGLGFGVYIKAITCPNSVHTFKSITFEYCHTIVGIAVL